MFCLFVVVSIDISASHIFERARIYQDCPTDGQLKVLSHVVDRVKREFTDERAAFVHKA